MKYYIRYMVLMIPVILLCPNVTAQDMSFAVSYPVQILNTGSLISNDMEIEEGSMPYHDHILRPDRVKFLRDLIFEAGSDKKPVYDYRSGTRMNPDQVRAKYCSEIQTTIYNPEEPWEEYDTSFIYCRLLIPELTGIWCNETWTIKPEGIFEKRITGGYGPMLRDEDGSEHCMFLVKGEWPGFRGGNITGMIHYTIYLDSSNSDGTDLIASKDRDRITEMIGSMVASKYPVYSIFNSRQKLNPKAAEREFRSYGSIMAIDFFETWSLDDSGNLQKEVLAFVPVQRYDSLLIRQFIVYGGNWQRQYLWDGNYIVDLKQ